MNTVDTDLITFVPDKGLLKRRRIWYILAIVLAVLSFFVQVPLIFLAAFLALFVGLLPNVWYRTALRHMVVHYTASQHRLFFGEEMMLVMYIDNQKWLPLPWLRSESNITPPITVQSRQTQRLERISQIANTWQMWSFQRVTRRYPMLSRARGCYTIGPVMLRSSDPFGWLESSLTLPIHETVIVYPLIAPVEASSFRRSHPSAHTRRGVTSSKTPCASPVYAITSWATTHAAFTGKPRHTREHCAAKSTNTVPCAACLCCWIRATTRIPGWALAELQELTISAAASIAVWALDESYMVGLLANSGIMIDLEGQGRTMKFYLKPLMKLMRVMK